MRVRSWRDTRSVSPEYAAEDVGRYRGRAETKGGTRLRKACSKGAPRDVQQDVRFHGSSIRPGACGVGTSLHGPSKGLIIILSQITGKSYDEFTSDSWLHRSGRDGFHARARTLMRVVDRCVTIEPRPPPSVPPFSSSWIPRGHCMSLLPRRLLIFSEAQTSGR